MSTTEYHPFPNTHWSLVRRAGGTGNATDLAAQREAFATLLARYQPALRSYLRIVRQMPAHEADDLLQAFIADQLLEHQLIKRADETRGRFRSLLLTSLNNFAISRARKRQVRAADSLESDAIDDSQAAPDAVIEAAWARALVGEVIAAMRDECTRTGREDIWTVFEGRVLADAYGHSTVISYEQMAARLTLASPTQAANLLVTAKRMYARLMRAAVAEYEKNADDIEAEIVSLREILARDGTRDAAGE